MNKIMEVGFGRQEDATRAVFQQIFTNNCLVNFTWMGSSKKKSFSDLKNTINLIVKTIRKKHPTFSHEELKNKAIAWLNKSAERLKRDQSKKGTYLNNLFYVQ